MTEGLSPWLPAAVRSGARPPRMRMNDRRGHCQWRLVRRPGDLTGNCRRRSRATACPAGPAAIPRSYPLVLLRLMRRLCPMWINTSCVTADRNRSVIKLSFITLRYLDFIILEIPQVSGQLLHCGMRPRRRQNPGHEIAGRGNARDRSARSMTSRRSISTRTCAGSRCSAARNSST
jgi:hypothetical protein